MPAPAEKAKQEAEAEARRQATEDTSKKGPVDDQPEPLAEDHSDEPIDDGGEDVREAAEADDGEKAPPQRRTPQDIKRAAMAKKFTDARNDGEFDGDLSKPENFAGSDNVAKKPEEAEKPAGEEESGKSAAKPSDQRKFKLKVYDKEIEVTEDEMIALAQQAKAGETIIGRAKARAQEIEDEARRAAESRAKPAREEPGDKTKPETEGDTEGAADQRDPFEEAVHDIQFGDPKESAPKLRKLVEDVSKSQSERLLVGQQISREQAKEVSAVEQFARDNPDLVKDRRNVDAIKNESYAVMRDELLAAGVKPEVIHRDNESMMQQHRYLRINGAPLSDPLNVLVKAKKSFEDWRGTSGDAKPNRQQGNKPAVKVDRAERRATIPSQPSHAARSPRGNSEDVSAGKAPTPSEVIKGMRKSRNQPVA